VQSGTREGLEPSGKSREPMARQPLHEELGLMTGRPTFTLVVRAEPGVDPERALRRLLKAMLRAFGLRVVQCRPTQQEEHQNDQPSHS
jgi:hypothetical protein